MKPPRIKHLMIAVALAGILTWVGINLHRRWMLVPGYRAAARFHAQHERVDVIYVREPSHVAGAAELAAINRKWKAYHGVLRRKYERAAAYPWLPLPPDPPEAVPLSDPATGRSVGLQYH